MYIIANDLTERNKVKNVFQNIFEYVVYSLKVLYKDTIFICLMSDFYYEPKEVSL